MDLSKIKRRSFIKQTSKIAGGMATLPFLPGCLGASEKQSKQDYPIIDTHQHLSDNRFKLRWIRPPFDKEEGFMLPQYRTDVEGLNFVKSIYMEVGAPKESRREEAYFALEIAEDSSNNTAGAILKAIPDEDDFREYVSEFAKNPYLKGVRGRLSDLEVFNSDLVTDNLRWLGEQGLLFELLIKANWLSKVVPQIEKCSNTTLIVNHCGSVDPMALLPENMRSGESGEVWKNGMKALAERENVICKISGLVNKMPDIDIESKHLAPTVNYCLDTFGPDRVVFATDWPVCRTYSKSTRGWVGLLKEIVKNRSIEEQKKLFHDNAARIYKV